MTTAGDAGGGRPDVRVSGMAIASLLDAFPGLVDRLLVEHVRGPDGRCRCCANGAQSGFQRWPCRIFSYAAAAADRRGVGA